MGAQLFCTQALLGAMIALRLTLLATAAFAAPAAEADADPQFLLGHGLAYLPPSSTTSSPSARSLSRPSLSARDAMLSLTAPPSPLLLAGTSPDTRSPHALTSSMLSPMATMARGRLRPTPSSSSAPPTWPTPPPP